MKMKEKAPIAVRTSERRVALQKLPTILSRCTMYDVRCTIDSRFLVSLGLFLLAFGSAISQPRGYSRYQSAHFTLVAPTGGTVGRLLDELELAYRHVRDYGVTPPSKVEAACYSTTSEFVAGSGGLSINLAVAVGERIHLQPVSVLMKRGEFARALRHELTHTAVAAAARRGLPRWMNEGLAMIVAGEGHPESMGFKTLLALEDTLRQSRRHSSLRSAYAASKRLVERMIERWGKSRIVAMVAEVGKSGGFEERFRKLAGESASTWGTREVAGGGKRGGTLHY